MKYGTESNYGWSTNAPSEETNVGWFLTDGEVELPVRLPGTTGYNRDTHPDESFDTYEECEAANRARPPIVYTHDGGLLGVSLLNPLGEGIKGTHAPTWVLLESCGSGGGEVR